MQNRMFFVLLRPIFCEKWKNSPPPIRKEPPLIRLNLRNWKKNCPEFWRRPFFFFFFWRSPNFWAEKTLNFRSFRDISSQISDKSCETDSRSMKIRVKVVCTLSHSLQNSPPFSKSWLRACVHGREVPT